MYVTFNFFVPKCDVFISGNQRRVFLILFDVNRIPLSQPHQLGYDVIFLP